MPQLGALDQDAQNYIRRLMGGQLGAGTQSAIQNAAARQSVASGMPGASRIGGSIFGNRVLRDIGRSAEDAQQQGFQNYLGTFGNLRPTAGQSIQQSQFQQDFGLRQAGQRANILNAQRQLDLESQRRNEYGRPVYGPLEYSRAIIDRGPTGQAMSGPRYEYKRFI